MDDWKLAPGQVVRRVALHNELGGVRQGGISPAKHHVFLFTDDAVNQEHGYLRDHWDSTDPDLFHYCGEGQVGNQQVARYNGSVLNASRDHRSIRLFQGVRGQVTYVAELIVDQQEPYYWAWGPGRDGVGRRVLMIRLRQAAGAPTRQNPRATPTMGLTSPLSPPLDLPYRPADERASAVASFPAKDLDTIDRAMRGHAITQNLLAEWLVEHRLVPLSPGPSQPAFDLAWRERGELIVAEVKSMPAGSELPQLRLGLGQVLDYAHTLSARPVLVVERRPADPRWLDLCGTYGVTLVWPSRFDRLLGRQR
jgi:hypothetical protein